MKSPKIKPVREPGKLVEPWITWHAFAEKTGGETKEIPGSRFRNNNTFSITLKKNRETIELIWGGNPQNNARASWTVTTLRFGLNDPAPSLNIYRRSLIDSFTGLFRRSSRMESTALLKKLCVIRAGQPLKLPAGVLALLEKAFTGNEPDFFVLTGKDDEDFLLIKNFSLLTSGEDLSLFHELGNELARFLRNETGPGND
ncbi:MAG TPA: hypothetical protein VFU15_05565 [Bacteroidia bacterium]|nr:hypothetical protein [Bacteroidia bacterium]